MRSLSALTRAGMRALYRSTEARVALALLKLIVVIELVVVLYGVFASQTATAYLPKRDHLGSIHTTSVSEMFCVTMSGATRSETQDAAAILQAYIGNPLSWKGRPDSRISLAQLYAINPPLSYQLCEDYSQQDLSTIITIRITIPTTLGPDNGWIGSQGWDSGDLTHGHGPSGNTYTESYQGNY